LTSDWPDSELIAGSRAEPTMFSEIFDRHHRELYRYLRRRVGPGLAADLAAETFVTAFARRGAYRPQSTDARPWLYGIAHNLLPGPRAARPAPPSAAQPVSAAFVLRKAASAAARQTPGHGRFFAAESEILLNPSRDPQLKKSWIGNGVPGRLVLEGKPSAFGSTNGVPFGTSGLTWAQLQHLPTAPGPLLADIAEASRQGAPHPDVPSEFSIIIGLLHEAPAPPALRSALYRAAAMLPGITLIGPSRDLIGRAATEVYLPPDAVDRLGTALFFDPDTGAVLSEEDFYLYGARCSSSLMGWAALASGYVSSDYQLPPGASGTVKPVVKPAFNPACPALTPQ